MNNRIKEIRINKNLTQEEFAKQIGITSSAISNYESGLREPMDVVIKSICREYFVYEEWLRYGTGPIYKNKNDKICEKITNILLELDDRDWETIDKLASAIVEGRK